MSESLVHAAAGAAGGCVAMAITYPLISVSTRAQVETKRHPGETTLDSIRRFVAKEGIAGLYDGLSSSLLAIAVTNGAFYAFYEESRTLIANYKAKRERSSITSAAASLSMLESILASFLAGSATSIISNPIWVINTRQTVRTTVSDPQKADARDPKTGRPVMVKKLGFAATLKHIIQTDGPGALFNGLGPALLLVANPIISYTAFEQMKNLLLTRRAAKASQSATGSPLAALPLTDLDFFALGALSKLLSTGFTYPWLTVKSRMQSGQAQGRSYKSTFHGITSIIQSEGPAGLYRGISTKLLQSVLTNAFLFMSKERFYLLVKSLILTLSVRKNVAA
ncbi:uncharacterized protein L969DRAFT_113147 [Mixia osmundae IAM 14324]|uniref:Uncharacterized protein n=1 Tax=Mixia osmundae (strain CBS 9802 / IAM 14324 / JCM 22182 / KY 12970) TaxID=764103 RepID=G7E4M2_MIXOS|nr:uncharacterized protein L969DRAFT_113147 [Mixia osmundae IAM 14324]KEI41838.1 hypothetical protein L969DRAFT_113147 [Mixia osmundae IAM 14324]GAA97782.1 hypothetical protein E5Q_04461 [Mixia osmundae IAM 14324]